MKRSGLPQVLEIGSPTPFGGSGSIQCSRGSGLDLWLPSLLCPEAWATPVESCKLPGLHQVAADRASWSCSQARVGWGCTNTKGGPDWTGQDRAQRGFLLSLGPSSCSHRPCGLHSNTLLWGWGPG